MLGGQVVHVSRTGFQVFERDVGDVYRLFQLLAVVLFWILEFILLFIFLFIRFLFVPIQLEVVLVIGMLFGQLIPAQLFPGRGGDKHRHVFVGIYLHVRVSHRSFSGIFIFSLIVNVGFGLLEIIVKFIVRKVSFVVFWILIRLGIHFINFRITVANILDIECGRFDNFIFVSD